MILSEVRDYLKVQQRVTLADLVIHFNMDADALRGLLAKWVRKGKVQKISANEACGTSCCKCDSAMTEIYEWQEPNKS